MKKLRLLLITLCVSVLMGSMAVTAYAGGGEEWDGLDPVEPLPAETVDPDEGFTEDGNLVTRDLLYDKATNKQFITVQTSGGNTFYIVIDYDKPTDEDGEQYHTYFLNMVDEADLLAAMQAAGGAGVVLLVICHRQYSFQSVISFFMLSIFRCAVSDVYKRQHQNSGAERRRQLLHPLVHSLSSLSVGSDFGTFCPKVPPLLMV